MRIGTHKSVFHLSCKGSFHCRVAWVTTTRSSLFGAQTRQFANLWRCVGVANGMAAFLSLNTNCWSQLAEHGGLDGLRDKGVVESALARPQNLDVYASADPAALAAAYAYGLAPNYGFTDGN